MRTFWLFTILIFLTKSHCSPIASNAAQLTFKDQFLSRPNLNNERTTVLEEVIRTESEEGAKESKNEKQIHDELSPSILKDIETILMETTNDDMVQFIEEQTHDSPHKSVQIDKPRGIELVNQVSDDDSEPTERQKLAYILRIFDIIIINPLTTNVKSYNVDNPIHLAENTQENNGILIDKNILEDSELLLNKDRSRSFHQGPVKRSAQFFYPAFVGGDSGISGYRPAYTSNSCCGQYYPTTGSGYGPPRPGFGQNYRPGFGQNYRPGFGQGIRPGYGQGFGVTAAYVGAVGGGGGFIG